MHGNTLTLLYIPRTIQDFHAHLYVPCAIQDFHASIVLPKGRIDYIRPLGHIGFSCIYTSLGPYRIYMYLYILYEGCITVGGVYIDILCILKSNLDLQTKMNSSCHNQGRQYQSNTRLDGCLVAITGANTGIGKYTALDLSR